VEKNKDLVIIENLLKLSNIDANLKNRMGDTPLFLAATQQKEGPCRLISLHPTSQMSQKEMERIMGLRNGRRIVEVIQ
jgi:hypothetical protein